jgi:uncharacterized surface anchored protein
MKTLTWTQRICIGSTIAVASLFAAPGVAGVAGADTCNPSYPTCSPSTVESTSVVPPSPAAVASDNATQTVNGSSSLPFTGADIGELAVVGAGAIVLGGVLARRRRSAS